MSSGETKERQCFVFNDIFLCTKAILHKRWAGSDTSVATYEYKWGHAMASCLEVKYKGNPVADTGMKDNNGNPVMIFPIVLTFQTERVRQKRILYALSETDRTAWGQELERVRQGPCLQRGIGKQGRSHMATLGLTCSTRPLGCGEARAAAFHDLDSTAAPPSAANAVPPPARIVVKRRPSAASSTASQGSVASTSTTATTATTASASTAATAASAAPAPERATSASGPSPTPQPQPQPQPQPRASIASSGTSLTSAPTIKGSLAKSLLPGFSRRPTKAAPPANTANDIEAIRERIASLTKEISVNNMVRARNKRPRRRGSARAAHRARVPSPAGTVASCWMPRRS